MDLNKMSPMEIIEAVGSGRISSDSYDNNLDYYKDICGEIQGCEHIIDIGFEGKNYVRVFYKNSSDLPKILEFEVNRIKVFDEKNIPIGIENRIWDNRMKVTKKIRI